MSPTSFEAPAAPLASSADGARGSSVEDEVLDAFRLSESDVRSARMERARPAEARARERIACEKEWGDACRARAGADLPPARRGESIHGHPRGGRRKNQGHRVELRRQASILVAQVVGSERTQSQSDASRARTDAKNR